MGKKPESNAKMRATLVAVWPGMGNVALTAGYYLMARLRMHETDPLPARDLFDPEYVEIKDGLVRPGTPPQGRIFLWKNPKDDREVLVYLGEAQPPYGKNAFCDRLLDLAAKLGVADVYTFAALATDMSPTGPSRVLGVATDGAGLAVLRAAKVEVLKTGRISGLNGVFLAAASERGMRGIGLLGEIPGMATQVSFPRASRRVLEIFSSLAGIELDLKELIQYEETMDRQMKELLARLERSLSKGGSEEEAEPELPLPEPAEPRVSEEDRGRVKELFEQARKDRSKTFELKRELDRLGLFKEFEDRFLDLFRGDA